MHLLRKTKTKHIYKYRGGFIVDYNVIKDDYYLIKPTYRVTSPNHTFLGIVESIIEAKHLIRYHTQGVST